MNKKERMTDEEKQAVREKNRGIPKKWFKKLIHIRKLPPEVSTYRALSLFRVYATPAINLTYITLLTLDETLQHLSNLATTGHVKKVEGPNPESISGGRKTREAWVCTSR